MSDDFNSLNKDINKVTSDTITKGKDVENLAAGAGQTINDLYSKKLESRIQTQRDDLEKKQGIKLPKNDDKAYSKKEFKEETNKVVNKEIETRKGDIKKEKTSVKNRKKVLKKEIKKGKSIPKNDVAAQTKNKQTIQTLQNNINKKNAKIQTLTGQKKQLQKFKNTGKKIETTKKIQTGLKTAKSVNRAEKKVVQANRQISTAVTSEGSIENGTTAIKTTVRDVAEVTTRPIRKKAASETAKFTAKAVKATMQLLAKLMKEIIEIISAAAPVILIVFVILIIIFGLIGGLSTGVSSTGTGSISSSIGTGEFSGTLSYPTSSRTISAGYPNYSDGTYHGGVDFPVATGTSVCAAADGTVTTVRKLNTSYGYYILIDHGNGVSTLYAHNSELLVSVGDTVTQGQVIAKSGSTGNSTGPHCHFEVRVNGTRVNPLDYLG